MAEYMYYALCTMTDRSSRLGGGVACYVDVVVYSDVRRVPGPTGRLNPLLVFIDFRTGGFTSLE